MRIIAKKTLKEFWEKHNDCEQQLKAWHNEAKKAKWENHNELKEDYPSASILANDRVVFNIKGNHYRLIVCINYRTKLIKIRFIGTHKSYNKIDAKKI